jgi:SAM-dependent methyltransferase
MLETMTRILRAVATNQVARWAPAFYVRATGQTGRGESDTETVEGIARYFRQCVGDYFDVLGVPVHGRAGFLQGKQILEYGPGDLPGVALLLVAMGAEKVFCVDRFSLVSMSDKNRQVIDCLASGLTDTERLRFDGCFQGTNGSTLTLRPARLQYVVRSGGLSGIDGEIDLVISRAVLEHVADLDATFADMIRAMRPGALAIHQVDLRSHGLHRANVLDFLSWSPVLWKRMYSHKGVPNRCRVDHYRDILAKLPVEAVRLEVTAHARPGVVAAVRHQLAEPFRHLSDEDLAALGFWTVFRKNGA